MLDPTRRQAYTDALNELDQPTVLPLDVVGRLETLSPQAIRLDWVRLGVIANADGHFDRAGILAALEATAKASLLVYEPQLWDRLEVPPLNWEDVNGLTVTDSLPTVPYLLAEQAADWGTVRGFEHLLAPSQSQVTPHPYQLEAVTRVLREMKGCAILADEVGLGKTIEAGLILKEYILRGMVRTALILVPASLVDQWKDELSDRFGIPTTVLDRPNLSATADVAIVSIHRAKRSLADELLSRHWDLIIVDEAHMLKDQNTVGYKFVYALKRTFSLLLTATPVQNDLRELYNLITLAKPGLLRSRKHFRTYYMSDRRKAKNVDLLKELLAEVMIRNRRSTSLVELPPRVVHTVEVELNAEELAFHQAVVKFVHRVYQRYVKGNIAIGYDSTEVEKIVLTLIILLKESCSSNRAVLSTLAGGMRRRIMELAEKTGKTGDLTELDRVILHGQTLGLHSKTKALGKLLKAHPRSTIVYSEFRQTLEAIRDYLTSQGHRVTIFHGGLSGSQRRQALNTFREHGGIFLSSEAGGQGLNLQFCHQLVNYDIPWNPTRLEQRIGRVHRYGQTQTVQIFNFSMRDTIEEYILWVLSSKINMFQQVIGELETILSFMDTSGRVSFEYRLSKIILDAQDFGLIREKMRELGNALRGASESYQLAKTQTETWLEPLT
ncbi:MAG: DEAD/DEAH box helicase [Candidatus Sericytochromatia bacterium]|nr:DEAD/DEAH box helicase [Candidatus Sericytochromatia bacterium]